MAAKKSNPRFTRRRSSRKTRGSKRSQSGRFRRFLRALSWSALFSFVLSTWVLHSDRIPQLNIQPQAVQQWVVAELKLDQLIPTLSWAADTKPATAPQDYSQAATRQQGTYHTQFTDCPDFFPNGHFPSVPQAHQLRELCFSSFAILHHGEKKTPVFVAQRLDKSMLQQAQKIKRTDRFYEEARLPNSQRARLEDYRGSGYDRGHMAPAGDMHSEEAMAQSFSLANIVPQNPQHNRGAWNKIEQDTRKYVSRSLGDVYIFTGPVFEQDPDTIGPQQVAVPKYLYKVVYDATTNTTRVHWHENSEQTIAGEPISYVEFQRRTGLDLLPQHALQ